MPSSIEQDRWIGRMLGITLPEAAAPTGSNVAFQKLRLDWVQTRQRMAGGVATVRDAILAQTRDSDGFAEVESNIGVLDGLIEVFDDRLADALDAIYVCDAPARRPRLVEDAKAVVNEYATFVATDPLMGAIDANPFVRVSVAADARKALEAIGRALR